jgi:rhomboid family GlyGly-CTERM serine protease
MPMRPFNISMAERCALAIAAVALLLTALGVAEALEYRRALLASEPWRLITGHLVHINWAHAVINVLALLIVARLFSPDLTVLRQMTVLLTAGFVISAGLTLGRPDIAWYRGLSGVLHALFFAGATTWLLRTQPRSVGALWLPAALFFGGWIKVALEQPTGNALPYADWLGTAVVTQAHLLGAISGTLLGLVFAATDRRRNKQRAEQQQLQPR